MISFIPNFALSNPTILPQRPSSRKLSINIKGTSSTKGAHVNVIAAQVAIIAYLTLAASALSFVSGFRVLLALR